MSEKAIIVIFIFVIIAVVTIVFISIVIGNYSVRFYSLQKKNKKQKINKQTSKASRGDDVINSRSFDVGCRLLIGWTLAACFSRVPKRLGCISGDIILFVSSERRLYEARNFAVIFMFIPFTTFVKTSFTELAYRSFTNGLSGRKRFGTFEKGAPGLSFNYGDWKFSLFTFQHLTRYIFFLPISLQFFEEWVFSKGRQRPLDTRSNARLGIWSTEITSQSKTTTPCRYCRHA